MESHSSPHREAAATSEPQPPWKLMVAARGQSRWGRAEAEEDRAAEMRAGRERLPLGPAPQ